MCHRVIVIIPSITELVETLATTDPHFIPIGLSTGVVLAGVTGDVEHSFQAGEVELEPLLGGEGAAPALNSLIATGKGCVPTDLYTTELVVSICDVRSKIL